ncbi:MAG TPA: universal stress protein [Planctomycetota bacterium]|nr:universal stress protein [Planctomycetota bacterium]
MIVGERIPAEMPRILVPAGEDPSLIRFAAKFAKAQNAAVMSIFVRDRTQPGFEHLSSRGRETMTLAQDPAARAAFQSMQRWCGEEGVPVLKIYSIHHCLGEVLLDHAVTWGVDAVIMGATRRKELPPVEAGPHLTQVYAQLPRSIPLVIHT